jgi:putative ABC transport system substrate-binding protein
MVTGRALRAQQKATPVIGYLSPGSPGPLAPSVAATRQRLSDSGYVEGQNLVIEYRWAEGHYDQLPALAADLASRNVEVILATGAPSSALAAKSATSTIPIVFTGGDPVADGLVASLVRPGGNLTGMTFMEGELMPKQLELLSELGIYRIYPYPMQSKAYGQAELHGRARGRRPADNHHRRTNFLARMEPGEGSGSGGN